MPQRPGRGTAFAAASVGATAIPSVAEGPGGEEAAASACGGYDTLRSMPDERFGERLSSSRLADDGTVMAVFAAPGSGTWTMMRLAPRRDGLRVGDRRVVAAGVPSTPRRTCVNSLKITLTLAAGLAVGHGLAGGTAAPLAQQGSGIPSPSDAETTGTGAPTVRPQPDVHGRAGSGEGQQHGSDSASPGSGGGGVSPSDPAGSGPTMNESGAPPATGGAQSPASTGQ